MQMPHFELMNDNTVKLCGFDHLAEKFLCVVKKQYLYLQPIAENQQFNEHNLLITRTEDFLVKDPIFYRLIQNTQSDKLKYYYLIVTNSYIPIL